MGHFKSPKLTMKSIICKHYNHTSILKHVVHVIYKLSYDDIATTDQGLTFLFVDFIVKDWKITRTYEQCCNRASPQFDGDKKGVINKPVMNVAFTKVIPDTLHLLLRIRGKLLNQVLILNY